ncbi:hypothetical protein [Stenotrophomonas geniculata]|uniref:hypothetical protein n=1 Tax=Stenotrophomonas geniculata TaxID=86188 RepID=UPI001300BF2A|nr:hypothetical protein [Stenotrophomonas geniculata]WNF09037.1 hypothetical protein RKE57_13245 [Stenotrophomonas geniculata]
MTVASNRGLPLAAPLKPKEKAALLAAHGASDLTLHRTANGFAPRNHPEKLFTRRVMNWLDERVLIRYDDPQLPRKATLTATGIAAAEAEIAKARDLALTA